MQKLEGFLADGPLCVLLVLAYAASVVCGADGEGEGFGGVGVGGVGFDVVDGTAANPGDSKVLPTKISAKMLAVIEFAASGASCRGG